MKLALITVRVLKSRFVTNPSSVSFAATFSRKGRRVVKIKSTSLLPLREKVAPKASDEGEAATVELNRTHCFQFGTWVDFALGHDGGLVAETLDHQTDVRADCRAGQKDRHFT